MKRRSTGILIALAVLSLAVLILVPMSKAQGGLVLSKGVAAACTPGSWVNKAVYPLSVYGAATATDGTFAYTFGGNTIGGAQHSEANRYDPVTNTWSPLASMGAGAPDYLFHGEFGGNGKIYIVGGLTNGTTNRIYDIATNTYSTGAGVPVAVYDYGHAFSGGKFYLMGGIVGGVAASGVYAYDVAANTWTTLASLPQAEFNMAAGVIGGKIYVAGGSTGADFITNLYIYDIATNSWSSGPPKSIGTNFSAGTVVGDQLWVIGGGNPFAPDSFVNTEIFDPAANSWSAGPSLIQARSFTDAVTLNIGGGQQMALIVTGYNSALGTSINSVEANVSTCATPTPTPTPTVVPTNTPTPAPAQTLTALSPARLWVGLRNSDDQGTQFDIRVEVLKNGTPVASGLQRCMTGLTRNPNLAALSNTAFDAFGPVTFGSGDVLSLRVSTRIGTNPDGTKCAGPGGSHNNAVGLRLYYDAASRASHFDATISPNPNTNLYLHSDGGVCPGGDGDSPGVTTRFLDGIAPGAASAKCKNSSSVNFAGGNPFSEVGTWSLAPF